MLDELPAGLPLRPRAPGGGGRRHGRRLRPGVGPRHARQPAHRSGRGQRDGRDLQRPGEQVAAAAHRRPAGPRPHDDAGEPDEPRRGPGAAPVREVELRAARARRTSRPRSARGHPPRLAAAEGPRVRLDPDGRLGRRGRRRRDARSPIGRRVSGRAVADPEPVRALAQRLRGRAPPRHGRRPRRRRQRRLGGGGRAAPSASACPSGRLPRRAAGGSASPRATPTSAACCRRRSGPRARRSTEHDLVLVAGSLGVPVLPVHPRRRRCPRARRSSRSPATPTRPRAPRWATRWWPTCGSRWRRCWTAVGESDRPPPEPLDAPPPARTATR